MKNKHNKKIFQLIQIIIGIIISIFFLWLSFKNTNLNDFISSFYNANYLLLIIAMIILIGSVWIRAIRWKYLLIGIGETSTEDAYKATMIGNMGNNILPLKMGEILRAYAISKKADIIISGAFSSIIIERIVDIISLLLIITIIFTLFPITEITQIIAFFGYFILIGFLILTYLLFKYEDKFKKWYFNKQKKLNEKNKGFLAKHLIGFCQGIESLWQNPNQGKTIILSLLIWLMYFIFTILCILALNIDISISDCLKCTVLILTFTTFAILIPAAPGSIGTYQIATIVALQIIGININIARAFSIIYFLVQYLPFTIIGLYYFFQMNMHISDLEHKIIGKKE